MTQNNNSLKLINRNQLENGMTCIGSENGLNHKANFCKTELKQYNMVSCMHARLRNY